MRVSPRRLGLIFVPILALCLASQKVAAVAAPPSSVEFNRDIRPILSDHCFQCHGPDGSKRKAKLRLDLEESARADLGGRRAVVGGDLDASELYRRITSADDSERMPPPTSAKPLSADQ